MCAREYIYIYSDTQYRTPISVTALPMAWAHWYLWPRQDQLADIKEIRQHTHLNRYMFHCRFLFCRLFSRFPLCRVSRSKIHKARVVSTSQPCHTGDTPEISRHVLQDEIAIAISHGVKMGLFLTWHSQKICKSKDAWKSRPASHHSPQNWSRVMAHFPSSSALM